MLASALAAMFAVAGPAGAHPHVFAEARLEVVLSNRIHSIVEIGGAAFVFLFGLLLLSASLTGSA
ncbi:exported hypothetical protein [Mesorhizobium metallidurans STM 2683]|uniref:DUF1007 family protein n=1 Tax=Mesorhizobium metallidurans STM 2683 TaxID=1297569 RepID=M5EMY2_9HYPH|nr:DUF1007 family protein [Mesorhizobium metallidurans]CCV05530.1 exported hypothetical protein [Mesorhizobium metallidurans STM 2683]